MAYFDSPKNRVLWEMELKDLRKQKADFEAGRLHDYAGAQKRPPRGGGASQAGHSEQLEREEAAASKSAAGRPSGQAAGYGKKRPEGFGEEPGRAGAAKGAGAQIQQCKGQVMRI